MQRSIPFLWALIIILLVLNLLLLDLLNMARLAAIDGLGRIEGSLDSLANEVIVYNFEINQAVPMKADIPIDRTMEIPLNTSVPIDQVLTLPLQTPAGEIVVDVPVQTEVPIDMVVPVAFDQTISVDTVVHLETTLPVEIAIADTPLAEYLKQASSEVAQLKRRLSLKRGGEEVADETVDDVESSAAAASVATGDSTSPGAPLETDADTSDSEPGSESDALEVSQPTETGLPLSLEDANLGLCAHPYWPLWPGTTWTYNSRDTSYTQGLDDVTDNQALLSTEYEGKDIQASLVCSQEGLGGAYLGDMRRITELGDLVFSDPRGVFLPRSETMEELGTSWRQEMAVSGRVQADSALADGPVEGQITQGRAVALYTPVRFESVETPLGTREALRVEQQLDLELEIDYDLGGQIIPATEVVNLNTIYWFAEDIGLVKMHWRGGTLRQDVEVGPVPVSQEFPVPSLVEDQLVFLCVELANGAVECAPSDDVSDVALTVPPQPELALQSLVLPTVAGSEDSSLVLGTGTGESPGQTSGEGAWVGGDADARSELLEYAAAVESLGQRNSGAAEEFWDAALKYQNDQLTFDEFRAEFQDFAPTVREVIQGVNQLSPPPEAEAVHGRLAAGMANCDKAIDVMDEWFDTPSDEKRQAATLLGTGCLEQVTSAREELRAIVGAD